MNRRRIVATLAALAAALLLAAPPGGRAGEDAPLTVLAAASLADVLSVIGDDWRAKGGHPVVFSFDATSRLARQIEAGAPVDLFISADAAWMDHLEGRGLVARDTRLDLLGNRLVLVVPSDASFVPSRAADLASPWLRHLALAGENVPAGRYARAALAHGGAWEAVRDRVVTGEHVRATLAWVARGEAEAGVVYATDARIEPRVRVAFPFPEAGHPRIVYPAAVLSTSSHAAEARRFLEFLGSPEARAVFEAAGFTVLGEP